jgi:hypothetical protein
MEASPAIYIFFTGKASLTHGTLAIAKSFILNKYLIRNIISAK